MRTRSPFASLAMAVLFGFGACVGCSPVATAPPPPPPAASARAPGKPQEVWRRSWHTVEGHGVCATGRMIVDRAGNVYIPSAFWGRLSMGGSVFESASKQGIVVRVDPTGEAQVVGSKGLSPVSGDILQIALTGAHEEGLIALIDGWGDGMEWSKHVPMTAPASLKMPVENRHNMLVGDDAVATIDINHGSSLSLTRLGTKVWTTPVDEKRSTVPERTTHLAYDGGRRIAVAGGGERAGVVVFDIDGAILWKAPFDSPLHPRPRVTELRFDSEGALWVLGNASRYERVGDTLMAVAKPPPPGLMADDVTDGWAMRFDARGKRTLMKEFPAEHFIGFMGLDVYAGVAYFITFTWGSMEPHYKRPPDEPAKAVALLLGMDAHGDVHTVLPLGGRTRGWSQVVATRDGITVGISHDRWIKETQTHDAECELVHFVVR